jgi:nitroreductase
MKNVVMNRRSVYPKMFDSPEVTVEEVKSLLEFARWAPNHKNTQPWNFVVFHGEGKETLLRAQTAYLQISLAGSDMLVAKQDKLRLNASKSGAVIAIVMKRDTAQRLPVWEEMAAVTCAVQNMWLVASELGLGGYWSTGGATNADEIRTLLQLEPEDIHMGWFYLGKFEGQLPNPTNRIPVEQFTKFITG